MGYRAGDPNAICDRCGAEFHRSEMRKEWTGLLVCIKRCWEPKHPQLNVRGKKDKQSVRDARPEPDSAFGTTTMSTTATDGSTTISIASVAEIYNGRSVGVTLNDGIVQWSFAVSDPSGSTVSLNEGVRGQVDAGNVVRVASNAGDTFLNLTDAQRRANL